MTATNRVMRVNKGLAILIIIGMFVQLGVVGYVALSFHEQRTADKKHAQTARLHDIQASRAGCERGLKDRRDNAEFQKAQTKYILTVTGAKSVREDVKMAARKAAQTFEKTSANLTARSRIDCRKVYP